VAKRQLMTADRLREALAGAGLPATTTSLAECLWLACRIAPRGTGNREARAPDDSWDTESPASASLRAKRQRAGRPAADDPAAGALRIETTPGSAGSDARSVLVPAAPMLRDVRAVQRALRPFKRSVGSGHLTVVDEEATAARVADTGQWFPVLIAEPQRWLDLAIVADTGPTMWMWRPLVHELRAALSQLGAFRDVRTFYLVEDQLVSAVGGPRRDPATLIDPAGRRAVLVLSDCSGRHWWAGKPASALYMWARHGPTAIVQPLPERMWQRTAAPTVSGSAGCRYPGAPSTDLIFTPDPDAAPGALDALPVPVVQLDPVWLGDWARMIAGRGNDAVRTAVTYVGPRLEAKRERVVREVTLSVEDRVRRFQAAASPEAVGLAAHIAVSIPALPVMRLIQHTVAQGTRPSHLAEVVLSGLLRPVGPDLYEFIDEEVRKTLLATLPRSESWHTIDVLRRVSAEIERRAGGAVTTFPALLEIGSRIRSDAAAGPDRPFALVNSEAVRALENLAVPLRLVPKPRKEPAADAARPRKTPSAVGAGPYFFLSYARTPRRDPNDRSDPDQWVHKLYRDLCEVILTITDAPPELAGFMDRGNRLGTGSPFEHAQALATCRVFVPLYSPRYFESENCGKEWFAFARRVLNQRARGGMAPSAIVPAQWVPVRPENLPAVAASIQYSHSDFGARYNAEGFYGIMKLARYRADYQRAVHMLANRIVEAAEQARIGAEQPADYASLPSAFGPGAGAGADTGHLEIAVLAPDITTLPPGRTGDYYGPTPHTWSPYRPEYGQPLADYAADLARQSGLQSVVGAFEEHAADWTADGGSVPPSLCLVDPWATLSPAHWEQLRRLNQLEQSWVNVMVPWNSQDAEMARAEPDLRRGLSEFLGRKLAGVPSRYEMAATGIPTLEEFGRLLPQMSMTVMQRFRRSAPAYPPEGPHIERPRLRPADPEEPGESR
jgi:FxsC-like protein